MVMIRKKDRQPRPEIPKNEKSFIAALGLSDEQRKRFEVLVPNFYLNSYYEMDLVGLRPSGFIDEFEIKLSRSDFAADRKKTLDFQNKGQQFKLEALERGELDVNHFWYVTPPGLLDVTKDLPSFAGLIEIGTDVRVVKFPDRLHRRKASFEARYKIAQKASNRFWDLKEHHLKQQSTQNILVKVSNLDLTPINDALGVATWEELPTVEVPTETLDQLIKLLASNA